MAGAWQACGADCPVASPECQGAGQGGIVAWQRYESKHLFRPRQRRSGCLMAGEEGADPSITRTRLPPAVYDFTRLRILPQVRMRAVDHPLPLQLPAKLLQQDARAALAAAGIVVAVEEHRLLGEGEARAGAGGRQHDGRQRGRDMRVVQAHVVAIDDAPVRHDVVIDRVESRYDAAALAPAQTLRAADAEVDRPLEQVPIGRPHEPARLDRRIGPGPEYPGRRGVIDTFECEGAVGGGSFGHDFSARPSASSSSFQPPSRGPALSRPSRKAPCSVKMSCVPFPAGLNWNVASDEEIRLSPIVIE